MIGKTISHYRILEKLGEGGMGVVYKAEDTKLGRTVGLKFLPPDLTRDRTAKERFVQEARAASALDHPNICNVHEIDETNDGQTFIAMACYDGESLKARIERGPLKIEEALDITSQVAQGLAKAHGQGIIHRDIKPANILVTKDGLAKIVDFGLAKLAGTKLTKTGKTLGTAQYMSPEQARGERVDHRADIWSLGIVLYEMLTGKHAFPGEYEQAALYSILNEEPEPVTALRSGVPMELERIVKKMLAKSPGERYQHADEVVADISKLRKDLSGVRAVTPARGRIGRKWAIIGIAAAAVIVVLALALLKPDIFRGVPEPAARMSIAVISFDNQTGDASLDNLRKAIPNLLITKLEQSKYLQVATWERLHDLLKQIGKADLEVIDRDAGFEACLKGGIRTIVTGSFTRAGNLFVTDVKVLDVQTKESLASKSARGKGVESILGNQIDDLGKDVARAVGLSDRKLGAMAQPIADVTTTSMEAYNSYLLGFENLRKYYIADAARYFERAVELDSTFAMAYIRLAETYTWMGMGRQTEWKKAAAAAMRYSGKTPEKERLYINALCAHLLDGRMDKEMRLVGEFIEKYPQEREARYRLAVVYWCFGNYEGVLEQVRHILMLDPNNRDALGLRAGAYDGMGQFEKALSLNQELASQYPTDAAPIESVADGYFRMGRLDEALSKYQQAIRVKPDFGSERMIAYICGLKEDYASALRWIDGYVGYSSVIEVRIERAIYKGWYLAVCGRTNESIRELSNARLLSDSLTMSGEAFFSDLARSFVHYQRREYALSRRFLDGIMRRNEEEGRNQQIGHINLARYYIASAFNDLREDKAESARRRFKETKRLIPRFKEQGWPELAAATANACSILEAELLLRQGAIDKAIRIAERIPPEYPSASPQQLLILNIIPFERDVLARAYQKKGVLDKAISEYEKFFVFDAQQTDRRLILPIYRYRFAKLYDEAGQAQKALEQYRKFLTIMSEADIYQTEIADAKARVESLTAR